jgi:hypothetical protein
MKTILSIIVLFLSTATCIAQTRVSAAEDNNPYPNELATLKLYREAKWKSLRPFVSTDADIRKILGKPVAIYDELLRSYVAGYDDDFDWTIVVSVVGKGGEVPDSYVDRLEHIELFPKRRVSLVGADFSAFASMSVRDRSAPETTVYYDKFGLRYVIYAEDASDGHFHTGDLKRIIYGSSREDYERVTHKA